MRKGLPALLICGVLAACSKAEDAPKGRVIDCAVGGSAKFLPECFVEDSRVGGKRFLTVRHKAGGFRRFEMVNDGRGVVSADGADEATAQWSSQGVLEVSVAGDRYRFPARMKDDAPLP
ncbi:hypothetical protein [Novosphingobium subterraneum]|uniref:Lipoprotein n=1 Tax=Novosphingobium subterraneum TaxID=48936 RepID=A0A0B8ZPD7_9SPHN|nr:hypothetical protein [Novosphingobium subterraneum]KHS48295.1 hypothetical protein NJ75_00962 [Novosphingobium subterraneum]